MTKLSRAVSGMAALGWVLMLLQYGPSIWATHAQDIWAAFFLIGMVIASLRMVLEFAYEACYGRHIWDEERVA